MILETKGLENFSATLKTLKEFLKEPIENERDKAGIIRAFGFTFEQCWKAVQQEAARQGVIVGSPKNALVFAMQNKFILQQDERVWLEMLEDRNLTSHTYKKELADQVISRIQSKYLSAFDMLCSALLNL